MPRVWGGAQGLTESVTRGNEGFGAVINEVDEIKFCSDNALGFVVFFEVINPRDFRVKARIHPSLPLSVHLISTPQM